MRIGLIKVKKETAKVQKDLPLLSRFRGAVYAIIAVNVIRRLATKHADWIEPRISQRSLDLSAKKRNILVPRLFIYNKVVYELNSLQRFFVTFEIPTSSILSEMWFIVMFSTILLGVVLFVVSGTTSVRKSPKSCSDPKCYNDPELCPGRMVCKPVAPRYIGAIDEFCIIVYTIDYLMRLFTCWCVPPSLAGITKDLSVELNPPVQITRYMMRISNLIDLCAIVPFYANIGMSIAGSSTSSSFVRVLRLSRLLRILRVGKSNSIVQVLGATLRNAYPAIVISLFFVALFTVALAAIFAIIERGTFTVNATYPSGAFLRPSLSGLTLEQSPFQSIPDAIYFVIITQATVGYGDIYPTTVGGRALASFLAHVGVLVLALPISVIGSHFSDEYEKYLEKKALLQQGFIMPVKLTFYDEFRHDLHAHKFLHRMAPTAPTATPKLTLSQVERRNLIQHTQSARALTVALRELRRQNNSGRTLSLPSVSVHPPKLDILLAKVRVELARRRLLGAPRVTTRRSSEILGTNYVPPPMLPPRRKPWIAPRNYKYYKQPIKRLYPLSWVGRIFVTLNDQDASILGLVISNVTILAIFLSVIAYVLASIRNHSYQYHPSDCTSPACDNDDILCPNRKICEPVPIRTLATIDVVCVVIFTIDFGVRLLTCWAVPARVAHVLPSQWDDDDAFQAEREWRSRRSDPSPKPWYKQMALYSLQWFSVVDVLAIVPAYVEMSHPSTSASLSFLRVLRLTRALKLLKSFKGEEYANLVIKTVKKSYVALEIMAFIALLLLIFFGAVLYTCEHGTFEASSGYPDGQYFRTTITGDDNDGQESIFQSIALGMYWCAITTTTVGYGDFYPTSEAGRAMASIAAYTGLLVLAMPVGVIGNNFAVEYEKLVIKQRKQKEFEEKVSSSIANMAKREWERRLSDAALDCDSTDPFMLLQELVNFHKSHPSERLIREVHQEQQQERQEGGEIEKEDKGEKDGNLEDEDEEDEEEEEEEEEDQVIGVSKVIDEEEAGDRGLEY